ncbi:MAG: putative Ig domain-containing protein [Leptospiraceae bacterium]|nr:putative Ig domain-containing protein [Leptospiraceae bacterium]
MQKLFLLTILTLFSCKFNDDKKLLFAFNLPASQSLTFSIGGNVSGLLGSGLILKNLEVETITISTNSKYLFTTKLANNAKYSVTINKQPSSPNQICSVANSSGEIASNDVQNINVSCITSSFSYSNSSYEFTLNTAIPNYVPTTNVSIISCSATPNLPNGLSLSQNCTLSGTPNIIQSPSSYTITGTDSSGNTVSTTVSLSVTTNPPSLLTYSGSPYTFTQSTAITNLVPTYSGTVTSCTSTPTLPAGLSIQSNDCQISGTPSGTQAATAYTITATNAYGSTNTSINITINAPGTPPSSLSYSNSSIVLLNGSVMSAYTPSVTGSVTSCTSSPALPTGLTLSATTCALSGTPTVDQTSTSYTITATNAFGSTNTTLSITISSTVKRIFLSNTTANGDLKGAGGGANGKAGADNICNADGNKPNASTYKAIIFVPTSRTASPTTLDWALQPNTIYIRRTDSLQVLSTNSSSVFNFGILFNSTHSSITALYWTGFNTSSSFQWQSSSTHCGSWEDGNSSASGTVGSPTVNNYEAIAQSATNVCNLSRRLLCAEQ